MGSDEPKFIRYELGAEVSGFLVRGENGVWYVEIPPAIIEALGLNEMDFITVTVPLVAPAPDPGMN